jgi:threonine dehydrogenase-like Zn-dependent dehydrogenase
MSRHAARQTLAREFGATDIVTERGDQGVARIKELTKGIGADAVLECVGGALSRRCCDRRRPANRGVMRNRT